MRRRILTLLGVCALVVGMAGVAAAAPGGNGNGNNGNGNGNGGPQTGSTTSVPEIDPSTAAQAMALLTGGVLVFKASRKSAAN